MPDRIDSILRQLDKVQRPLGAFDPVSEVTSILDAFPDKTAFFSALIRVARRAFFSNHEAILSYHNPTRRWFVEASQDMEDDTMDKLKGLSRTAIEKSRAQKSSLFVQDARSDPLLQRSKSAKEQNIQSVLISPIFMGEEFWGIIYLANTSIPEGFDEASRIQLERFAEFAGKAITRCEQFVRRSVGVIGDHGAQTYLLEETKSTRMAEAMSILRSAAPREASVLLVGDTGTGKDTWARWIHVHSSRRDKEMFQINCATLAPNLVEVELFGIESGVATGVGFREGKLKIADGGTVFVNEVGDLPLSMQAKLLRAIEDRVVERIGGRNTIGIDVRFIFATSRDLTAMMERGEFRRDLYYRMNVFEVLIPSLSERREDIAILATHLLARMCERQGIPNLRISERSLKSLAERDWKGNIRELSNFIEYALAFSHGDELIVEPRSQREDKTIGRPYSSSTSSLKAAVAEFEESHIRYFLRQSGWVEARAARAMNLPEGTLRSKMKKYLIVPPKRIR